MQLNLFDNIANKALPPVCNLNSSVSYRQKFGLENPPKGTELTLKFMEGMQWYLVWSNCPDNENIIQGWFHTASSAQKYATENNWLVTS